MSHGTYKNKTISVHKNETMVAEKRPQKSKSGEESANGRWLTQRKSLKTFRLQDTGFPTPAQDTRLVCVLLSVKCNESLSSKSDVNLSGNIMPI